MNLYLLENKMYAFDDGKTTKSNLSAKEVAKLLKKFIIKEEIQIALEELEKNEHTRAHFGSIIPAHFIFSDHSKP